MAVKKLNSSSIAEIVVALAIIAMCFTVASLIFIRATSTTLKFQNFKEQTAIQTKLMEMMIRQEVDLQETGFVPRETASFHDDSLTAVEYSGNDNRILWKQEWLKTD